MKYAMQLEELSARHAEERARLEMMVAIEKVLPVQPEFIHIHSKSKTIVYEVDTLAEAVELMAKFRQTPYIIGKGSFTHVTPVEWMKESDYEQLKEETEINGPNIRTEYINSVGQTLQLKNFVRLSDETLVGVDIKIKQIPNEWRIKAELKFYKGEATEKSVFKEPYIGHDERIKWATGTAGSVHYQYFSSDWHNFISYMPNDVQEMKDWSDEINSANGKDGE